MHVSVLEWNMESVGRGCQLLQADLPHSVPQGDQVRPWPMSQVHQKGTQLSLIPILLTTRSEYLYAVQGLVWSVGGLEMLLRREGIVSDGVRSRHYCSRTEATCTVIAGCHGAAVKAKGQARDSWGLSVRCVWLSVLGSCEQDLHALPHKVGKKARYYST